MQSEPFGLPRGSVRATITLVLLAACVTMLFVPAADSDVKSMFILLTGIAIRDYFAVRSGQNQEDGPPLPPAVIGNQ
jgi:hypothetical protein